MQEKLQSIRERALERLNQAADTGVLEQIRVAVLGKKGELTALLRSMGQLAPEERPAMGQKVNELRALIEEKLAERERALKEREKEARLQKEAIDVTFSRAHPGPCTRAASCWTSCSPSSPAWDLKWWKARKWNTTITISNC